MKEKGMRPLRADARERMKIDAATFRTLENVMLRLLHSLHQCDAVLSFKDGGNFVHIDPTFLPRWFSMDETDLDLGIGTKVVFAHPTAAAKQDSNPGGLAGTTGAEQGNILWTAEAH